MSAWGHIRATDDIDLVPDPDAANLKRLAAVLEDLNGRVKVGDRRLTRESIAVFLRAGDKTYVVTELGDVDVFQGLPTIPRYSELDAEAATAELAGFEVRVCSLRHLVAMKRAADRPMDHLDIDALEAAHGESADPE